MLVAEAGGQHIGAVPRTNGSAHRRVAVKGGEAAPRLRRLQEINRNKSKSGCSEEGGGCGRALSGQGMLSAGCRPRSAREVHSANF